MRQPIHSQMLMIEENEESEEEEEDFDELERDLSSLAGSKGKGPQGEEVDDMESFLASDPATPAIEFQNMSDILCTN